MTLLFKKHTFPNHFSLPECAKAHLQQSRISKNFPEEDLRTDPRSLGRSDGKGEVGGGKGSEEGEGKGKGTEEGSEWKDEEALLKQKFTTTPLA